MSDDVIKKIQMDPMKVNVHEPWDVYGWCYELGCTNRQLIAAVKAVGVSAEAVRKHLGVERLLL
jgi:hypothetical protein